MQRKVVGIVVAVLAAMVGTVLLVSYVRGAEARATAGEELVEVYVVVDTIPAGMDAGENLAEFVRVETVPVKVQALGAVRSLSALENRVTAVELVAGEQLVETRFVTQSDFINREVGVVVPLGKVEITIALEPQRAVGGLIEPGDTVSVIGSFEPFEFSNGVIEVDGEEVALPDAVGGEISGKTSSTSALLLRKALVTAIQEPVRTAGSGSDDDEDAQDRLREAPDGSLLITLALDPGDAERLIFTQEFGFIWLASERSDVPEYQTEIQTRGNVYVTPPAPPTVVQTTSG